MRISLKYLLCVLCLYISGSYGQAVMTQTPDYMSVSPGDTATISCTASESVFHSVWKYDALAWLQQKPGQPPKQILYKVSERPSGIPERFQGSGSGTDFTLTIKGFTEDDEAKYYCMQYRFQTFTFGAGTRVEIKRRENAKPSALVFGPSSDELEKGTATILCLVNNFYPADVKVAWKADNTPLTTNVEQSEKFKDADKTYSMSSILSVSKETYKGHKEYTCEVTHVTLTTPLITSLKTSECTV